LVRALSCSCAWAQVKGQIARIARCLQDPEPRIAGLAHLFFEELSHKVTKVSF
jgi:condensin complex subunit 1